MGDVSFQVLQNKLIKFGFDMDLINMRGVARDMYLLFEKKLKTVGVFWLGCCFKDVNDSFKFGLSVQK